MPSKPKVNNIEAKIDKNDKKKMEIEPIYGNMTVTPEKAPEEKKSKKAVKISNVKEVYNVDK